jgi:hypothetical protein
MRAIFSFVLAAGEWRTGEGGNVNELLKSDQVHQFYAKCMDEV